MTHTDISIIVPCYNECANIRPLVKALHSALGDYSWEVVFVDDNSPDGTIHEVRKLAAENSHVRGILRIGRKGLSSAVIEGALSSSASVIAVMDGDMQHDETCLPAMIRAILDDQHDMAVASRHIEGGSCDGLSSAWRHLLSQSGIKLAQCLTSAPVTDPMSGFFAMKREWFEARAPELSGKGFKILLELLLVSSEPVKLKEVPMVFRDRLHGESKLSPKVMILFLVMLAENLLKKPRIKCLKFPLLTILISSALFLFWRKKA
ncbi:MULTISPECIES: polyprenol monophosphomannose synthase [Acetobacter]|uniref:polyprenol monophosphomannose synthase n=1 Tax=Acetobacter TaxID=434 RepID=UPI000A3B3DF4|nr:MULTISPECIES: polyprenol monophosphomannose synthase [Acetobacter]MBS0959165.1 polyprenol monophosphomannose synthase [Acetobacter thailandicus]MBS0984947.1 polyprenol monophosphomannose synthase [Acetobacter thailandicus]